MEKGGGSNLLISTLMRRTGGDSDVFLDKSSKKEKLKRLSFVGLFGEMDQLSHPIGTNSTSKRVKVLKKCSDHYGVINHVSAPRKLRSAMKKRESEMGGLSKDCTKKHKAVVEEFKDSKMSNVMTKDEEEVAEALFALAQTDLDKSPKVEIKPPPPLVEEIIPPNGKKSRNRCSVHVYICSFIKLLQTKIDKESNQGISDTDPQKITNNDYAQLDVDDRSKTTTTSQDLTGLHPTNPTFDSLQQVVPCFDTMNHDHSQLSMQRLPSTGCYQNWQNQRHDRRKAPVSGSKYTQGSLLQELGSGHASNTEQQKQCISMSLLASEKEKMQLNDCPLGYDDDDEKGGLLFVDGPMLKLTL